MFFAEESLFDRGNRREILRFAQNDNQGSLLRRNSQGS
jgi:hypothetical protein